MGKVLPLKDVNIVTEQLQIRNALQHDDKNA